MTQLETKMMYDILGRRVDHFFYVSEATRSQAAMLCPWIEGRSSVCSQYVPLHYKGRDHRNAEKIQARKKLGLPENAWIIGSAARFEVGKRIDVFLKIAAQITQEIPEAFFVLCGDGTIRPEMMELAETLGIADRVLFPGWIPALDEHLKSWDAFLFNSDTEAAGRVMLEAMAHGVPVVSSVLHSGSAEIINHPIRGYFHPTHDIGAMTSNILELYKNPGILHEKVESAAEYIGRECNIGNHGDRLMAAFQSIIAKKRLISARP